MSKFAYTSCEYLWHIVGNRVIKPVLEQVEVVSAFLRPETKTAGRSFLGLTGYYRRFMPMFSSVTKKSAPNQWSGVRTVNHFLRPCRTCYVLILF